jgi:D-serine deaminase-like pyridoxal phosphate-dependent protein
MKRVSKNSRAADLNLGPNAKLIGAPHSRERLATPALILDLDGFEHNLKVMMKLCKKAQLALRPHAKTHKSSRIAKLQIRAGAVGICVATLREAAAMVEAGVPGVLITSPMVGAAKIEALAGLIGRSEGLMVVVDNPENVAALEEAVRAGRRKLAVLVDVDIGMKRTGVPSVAGVLALVRRVQSSDVLQFAGIQAYSGRVQHIAQVSDRARVYGKQLEQLEAVLDALAKSGISPPIVSGGGTGTFEIDRRASLFTESQCGSYAVMDIEYEEVQLFALGANPYETALYVQCMVLSNNYRGSATIDGGFKCFHMDGPIPRPARGAPAGAVYRFYGDEFGKITLARKTDSLALGTKIELVTPHCDPTINLHSYFHCVRGDKLVDIWPVDARGSL